MSADMSARTASSGPQSALPHRPWQKGDRVMHPEKPEWGAGSVQKAENEERNGKKSQRVTVRFERAGTKVLSTAFAALAPADDPTLGLSVPETEEEEAVESLTVDELRAKLGEVPESCRDPFSAPKKRLRRTLDLYRFTNQGGSLLDWAAAVTGMRDPLTHFNRHELEAAMDRFARVRDRHALSLVRQLAKEAPDDLRAIGAQATPEELKILRGLVARR